MIDTHCHIDVAAFARDYSEVLTRARDSGVDTFVVPGVCRAGWPRLLQICDRESGCVPALGLHPLYLDEHRAVHLEELSEHAAGSGIVAIGEIGLDYWAESPDRTGQQKLFEDQLRLAAANGLPVLLHARKAHDQVLATLRRLHFGHGGIVHAFSGSLQQAQQYVQQGFKIGVGGTITFSRARRVRSVAATLPLAALVLETDAPDIPPAPHRQGRNSPEYLPLICNSLAQLRRQPMETISHETTGNARAVLHLG